MLSLIAKIYARHPPAIAITLGGFGLFLGLPYAMMIFWVGVGLQVLWLGMTGL